MTLQPIAQAKKDQQIQDTKGSQGRQRTLSALHLFRKDYIASQPKNSKDWFSKQAWSEVQQAFDELPEHRVLHYRNQKTLNVLKEHGERNQGYSTMLLMSSTNKTPSSNLCLGPSTNCENRVSLNQNQEHCRVEGTNHDASILANLLPADPDKLREATNSVADMACASTNVASEHLTSTDATIWPVGETNVLAHLVATRSRGVTLSNAMKDFNRRCQIIAGKPTASPSFPEKVVIHGKCGSLCQLEFSAVERLIHGKVCEALARLVSFDKPTKVVQQDVLVASRCEYDDGSSYVQYFFMTSVSNKGGFNKADSVQVLCTVVDRRSDDDYVSRLNRVHVGRGFRFLSV